tara:strand:- start:822 stop:1103 length:282 start_codon:yes stop_codon:yes gene_type:complete
MALKTAPADFKTKKPLYKPYKSTKSGKKGMVYTAKGLIHFGDSNMQDFTQHKDSKRRDSYLARSGGIKDKSGKSTADSKDSANYWSRKVLWKA